MYFQHAETLTPRLLPNCRWLQLRRGRRLRRLRLAAILGVLMFWVSGSRRDTASASTVQREPNKVQINFCVLSCMSIQQASVLSRRGEEVSEKGKVRKAAGYFKADSPESV